MASMIYTTKINQQQQNDLTLYSVPIFFGLRPSHIECNTFNGSVDEVSFCKCPTGSLIKCVL